MLLTDTAFIGITPILGNKSLAYAVLDRELKLITLADGEMDDVAAFIAGQGSIVAAINMPVGVNFGLVRAITKSKKPTVYQIRRNDLRLAEHELRERGISITKTPASVEECPAWMQAGFELYRKLIKMGFQKYPDKDAAYLVLETNSHACHCVMAGQIPLGRLSLAGRMQRQLVLYEHGLGIKDPMDFFEEVTRYKISKGILPMELLYLPDQLDAMAAAYTAWLAVKKQDCVFMVGDLKEGKIILPERELKEKYK